jgi:hypothetical protein
MARKDRLQEEYAALYPDLPDVFERLISGEDLAALEQRLGPRALFREERPAHLRIADTDQALRSLLGAPKTLPLTQWYMEVPVKSRRLAGCQWRLVGNLLPAGLTPEDRAEYPWAQYSYPEPRCLQVWLWRVFKPRPPPHPRDPSPEWFRPFGDIRWHPERGVWVTIELNADDGPAVAQQVGEWVYASRLASRGRPRSRERNHETILHTVCTIIRRRVARGDPIPNQRQVAALWNQELRTDPRVSAAQLQREDRSAETAIRRARLTFHLTFDDVVDLALASLKK